MFRLFQSIFDHLRLSFNASNAEIMWRIDVKYQYTIQAVCAYARGFRKRPGCALIGVCALIRTNTVTLTEWAPSPLSLPERKNTGPLNFHIQTTYQISRS